jgi:DNA-directed RNA polymerase subunit RPC12/RpoP
MSKKIVKCKNCHQEILQKNPSQCPYCKSKEFVFEEESQMDAEETDLKTGKVNSIGLQCPHCGAKQSVNTKQKEVSCAKCMRRYKVPEKARELL